MKKVLTILTVITFLISCSKPSYECKYYNSEGDVFWVTVSASDFEDEDFCDSIEAVSCECFY